MPVKLVDVIRASTVECSHRGDMVVVNSGGEVLYKLGDPEHLTFLRSASKPLQAIAALELGIAQEYNLDLKDIALILSSHSGEKQHIEALKGLMKKIGVDEDALRCGVHEPLNKDAASELAASGRLPSKLHCNCSGKHLGQIAASKLKGMPVESYYKPEHGIQADIQKVISDFSGFPVENIIKGIDGCGVPVYGVPLKNMALAYANLCDAKFMDGKYNKSQNYVIGAMTMYPEMVGGTGRFDTELMKNFGDRVIGKFGDEGVYCVGLPGKAVGLALKIEDGNGRAVGPAILETLLQMEVIRKDEIERMKTFWNTETLNHKGEKVGEIRAVFKIR